MNGLARKSVLAAASLGVLIFGVRIAYGQFTPPTCVPPNCNPAVIQNVPLSSSPQVANINITGDGGIGAKFETGRQAPTFSAATDYLYYGNVNAASTAGYLMLLQTGGADRLKVSLTGQLQLPMGSAAAPSYSFLTDTNTGIFSSAGDSMSFATNGVVRTIINNSGTTVNSGVLTVPVGSAAAPSIAFAGDTNTGIYRSGADAIGLTTGGVSRLTADATGLVTVPGNLTVLGTFTASGGLGGDGSALTNLNASNITTGTLNDARLSSNVALYNANGTYTGANTFSNAGNSFTGNGAGLTSLNASNLSSGTVNPARLPATVAYTDATQTFTGANTFSNAANSFTGVGSGLTALNATQLTSGTVPSARVSGTYANNLTFSGMTTFGSASRVVGVGQNLIYGNIDTTSVGSLLLLQNESVDRFRVAANGDTTIAGNLVVTGSIGGTLTEADTLQTVVDRGRTSTTTVAFGSGAVAADSVGVSARGSNMGIYSVGTDVGTSYGVYGNGGLYGVRGESGAAGYGVSGFANTGVYGLSNGAAGYGGYFTNGGGGYGTYTVGATALRAAGTGGTGIGGYFSSAGTETLRVVAPASGNAINIRNNADSATQMSVSYLGTVSMVNQAGFAELAFTGDVPTNLTSHGQIYVTVDSDNDGSDSFIVQGNSGSNMLSVYESGAAAFWGPVSAAGLTITQAAEQIRLAYDVTNYASFTTSSGGDLTIAPSGGDISFTGAGAFTGNLTVAGQNVCRADGTNCPSTLTGSGTANYVTKFTGTGSTVGNSLIRDDGTSVAIGNAPAANTLLVAGPTNLPIAFTATTNAANGVGIYGFGMGTTAVGVYGQGTGAGTVGVGTAAGTGVGVQGSGQYAGVTGTSIAAAGFGVQGSAPAAGVRGVATGVWGYGVQGVAAPGSFAYGVYGTSDSSQFNSAGVAGTAGVGSNAMGGYFQTNNAAVSALYAYNGAGGLAFTASGNSNFTGAVSMNSTLGVGGNTTLGDAAADTLTVNGTAVSIPNSLNIDANTLYVDSVNNRVGVGTAAPTAILEVNRTGAGTGYAANRIALAGVGNASYGDLYGVFGKSPGFGVGGDAPLAVYGNANAYPNSTGVMGQGTTYGVVGGGGTYGVYGTGTSYGVYGTNSPYGVRGDGTTMGGYMRDADGTSYTYLGYSNYGMYTPYDGYFGGKLGVGTTSPYANDLALSNDLSHNKFTLYETSASYSYGMGVVSGQLSFHVAHSGARFAFYSDAAASDEVFTIGGDGRVSIGSSSSQLYGGSRLYVRAEGSDNVAQFASYGLWLPKTGTSLYLGQTMVMGYSAALGTSGSGWLCLSGGTSGSVQACGSSSIRYKKDIEDLDMGLEEVEALRAVTFRWKESGKQGFGFVAEDVEKVNPLLVYYNKEGQVEGVQYPYMTALLAKAVQELDLKIEDRLVKFDTDLDAQEARIRKLEDEVRALRQEVRSLQELR